jgi:hypothetical protein
LITGANRGDTGSVDPGCRASGTCRDERSYAGAVGDCGYAGLRKSPKEVLIRWNLRIVGSSEEDFGSISKAAKEMHCWFVNSKVMFAYDVWPEMSS